VTGIFRVVTAAFQSAIERILRPIVRTLIARDMQFSEFSDLAKSLYVDACGRHFQLGGKRLTDSRISFLTGLQRKDIRSIRGRMARSKPATAVDPINPMPRIIAYWSGHTSYCDDLGRPAPLLRSAPDQQTSFEGLVAAISRDIHPRTVFDEMLRRGLISHDAETDKITLLASAFVPNRDDAALIAYFGANLGDHAEAAAENVIAAPGPGPHFERAVHYDSLSPASLSKLGVLARRLQTEALEKINAQALVLQEADDGQNDAVGRFRCGAFVFSEATDEPTRDLS
jgi:hypothetical protein